MVKEAKWIWYPEKVTFSNSFIQVRKTIKIKKDIKKAICSISADSRYKLFVNGKFISRGPAPYDPRYMYYDELNIEEYLYRGDNTIAILGYYIGFSTRDYVRPQDFSTTAGIIFQSDLEYLDGTKEIIVSDRSWKVRKETAWKSGSGYGAFRVLPMNEIFDARKYEKGWELPDYDDSQWKNTKELKAPAGKPTICSIYDAVNYKDPVVIKQYEEMTRQTRLDPRDIELLVEERRLPEKVELEGTLTWNLDPDQYFDTLEEDSYAIEDKRHIKKAYIGGIPVDISGKNRSSFIIFDFGVEVYGRVFFDIDAPGGTMVEVLVAEILKSGFISPEDNFNTWFRYICREGRQSFEFFEPIAFRYILLMIRNNNKRATLIDVGVNAQNYPFEDRGSFQCSDDDINSLWQIGKRTQKLCSQDTIFDNPFRERTQYCGDPELNMLGIYYQFGEYKLARKSLIQLSQSMSPEGSLLSCWPSGDRISRIKEAYLNYVFYKPEIIEASMYWVLSLWGYYLHSGDIDTLAMLFPRALKLKNRYDWMIGSGKHIFYKDTWFSHFYGDHIGFKNNQQKAMGGNFLFKTMLDRLSLMAKELGKEELAAALSLQANEVKEVLVEKYWSAERKGFYLEKKDPGSDFPVFPNVYALYSGCVPEGWEEKISQQIKKRITPFYPTPLMYGIVYLAISPYDDDFIALDLKNKWAKMPSIRETGTFSELWISDLDWAVRCQNVACPNYILPGEILGVKPVERGFRRFEVCPRPGFLKWAKGSVPSPLGDIMVQWQKENKKILLEVKTPEGFTIEEENILAGTIRRVYKYAEVEE